MSYPESIHRSDRMVSRVLASSSQYPNMVPKFRVHSSPFSPRGTVRPSESTSFAYTCVHIITIPQTPKWSDRSKAVNRQQYLGMWQRISSRCRIDISSVSNESNESC